ncbi:ALDH5A1 [Mytilus edulis]|uniref:ALDH5A1 n=1 Tax=Mytilus edulis TaxID=6550 RepID=A0A8S3SKA3_MYTED|nr:ALDH5A1 [Mytilus edulis]
MELGGNAHSQLLDSADLDQAVNGTMVSKFRCSGQQADGTLFKMQSGKGMLGGRGGVELTGLTLTDVTLDMKCAKEEIFGPIAAIHKCYLFAFKYTYLSFDQLPKPVVPYNYVYALSHGGYFFSQNISQVWRMAEKLEYGLIGVNEGLFSMTEAPFGGWKESGLGSEGSKYGLNEYLEIKYVCLGGM